MKLFLGLSTSQSPLSDEDDDVALLSVEMEPGEINDGGGVVKHSCEGTIKALPFVLDRLL